MKRSLVMLCAMIVLSGAARGQEPTPPPGDRGPENRRMMERVERVKKVRMIEMLELSEDQSARFVARMNEHEARHRDLIRQRQEVLDRIDRLIRNRAEDKELEKAYQEIHDLHIKTAEEGNVFFTGLKDILTTVQRGKLLLFERQFERELREAFRETQRRRHGAPE
jgi:hypothetical protein